MKVRYLGIGAFVISFFLAMAMTISKLPNDKNEGGSEIEVKKLHLVTEDTRNQVLEKQANTYRAYLSVSEQIAVREYLLKSDVAEEWGRAGWNEAVEAEQAYRAAVAAEEARARTSASTTPIPRSSGGGPLSTSQLMALANCEGSGVNGWRTGYFGIESDHPIGGLSWDEQVAWVQDIYNQHGASAWGVLCRPILGG